MKKQIYIVNNNLKKAYYNTIDKQINKQILSIEEFKKYLIYVQTSQALEYIYLNKKNKNFHYSKLLLENICNLKENISNSNLENEDIKYLLELKKDLIEKHLIHKNIYKIEALSNSDIYIQSHLLTDNLKELLKENNLNYIEIPDFNINKMRLVKYPNYNIEICDVVNKVASLLDKGVKSSEIILIVEPKKIVEASNLLNSANIISYYDDLILSNQKLVNDFINNVKNDFSSGEEFINNFKPKSLISSLLISNISSIYSSCLYEFNNDNLRFDYFKYKISNKSVPSSRIGIRISSSINEISNYKYAFVTCFDEKYPSIYSNNDYLQDDIKVKYSYLEPSYIKSNISKIELEESLSSISNLYLSRSEIDFAKNQINVSDLEKYDKIFEIKDFEIKNDVVYSKENILLSYSLLNQLNYQYGFDSSLYQVLKQETTKLNYKPFVIDNYNISLIDDSLINYKQFSFTSLATYATCPFKYLLNYIFKINPDNNTLNRDIGNICHKLLEIFTSNYQNKPIEEFKNEYKDQFEEICNQVNLNLTNVSKKDLFYFKKMYEVCLDSISDLQEFFDTFSFNKFYSEYEFSNKQKDGGEVINYNSDILNDAKIEGKIDLICENKSNKKFVLDYKTGSHDYNDLKCLAGIDMQLAFYTYSLSLTDSFKETNIMGFAYYQIPYNHYLYSKNRDSQLSGIFFNQDMKFDVDENEYKKYLKAPGKNNLKDRDQYFKDIVKTLTDLVKNIKSNNFKVTKTIVIKEDMCKYCPFKDCCFVNTSDENQVNQIGENVDQEDED